MTVELKLKLCTLMHHPVQVGSFTTGGKVQLQI